MAQPLFERLLSLCGKRCDDPELIAFHAEEGLEPPPTALSRHEHVRIRHSDHGYDLYYIATLKRPETWPPQLGPKGFLTYLVRVQLRNAFAPHLPAPFTLDLDPARAQALAIRSGPSRETHVHTVHRLYERGERSLQVRFGGLIATPIYTALTIDEVDNDDPRLARVSEEALAALDRKAQRLEPPPPKSPRKFPERRERPKPEPLPPVLAEAREALEAWFAEQADNVDAEDDDTHRIDFLFYTERPVHFMAPLSKAEEHEAEFYVFGADGTGSNAAFWLVHDAPPIEQPVVFIGSEGDDNRPVAKNLPDFLALLAAGIGPKESAYLQDVENAQPLPAFKALLDKYFPGYPVRSPKEIVEDAVAQYGDFEARIEELYYEQRMAELSKDED